MGWVLETVEQMAAENPVEHERSLFVMRLLFGLCLRISELVADERSTPVMGDFHQDSDNNWWLKVIGKGNKARLVTVSDDMLAALKRYRLHLGLPALPLRCRANAFSTQNKGKGPVTSTRQIRYLVQNCFDVAFERMRAQA